LEPDAAVNQALDVLAAGLMPREAHAHDSHIALSVSGLADDAVIDALGLYLVGLLAGIVRTNLRLSTALLDRTPEGRTQLAADVEALLAPPAGAPARAVEHFVADVRDPWIAEGIGHAILAIRNRAETVCLSGAVAAITVPPPTRGRARDRRKRTPVGPRRARDAARPRIPPGHRARHAL
jgi:hypothetical protein